MLFMWCDGRRDGHCSCRHELYQVIFIIVNTRLDIKLVDIELFVYFSRFMTETKNRKRYDFILNLITRGIVNSVLTKTFKVVFFSYLLIIHSHLCVKCVIAFAGFSSSSNMLSYLIN